MLPVDDGAVTLVNWAFNAWAKYPNYARDAKVGEAIARITGLPRVEPKRLDNGERVVLEGGGIETDGLDARTMQAKAVPGLYFVGEVVDVTGWLGGYNFQWAWASGWAAGQVA